jgi:hypothetical protein
MINSLALNFRATANPSPMMVANLAPGVNSDSGGNITFSGGLPNATSFTLDGIGTTLPRLFSSVEGIAEFRVSTAANSAEFAQPTDLTVITKSGTNAFHGGAFWYFQRQDFNSVDSISGILPTGNADTFGTSLSGPLVKNRTGSQEKLKLIVDVRDQRTITFARPTRAASTNLTLLFLVKNRGRDMHALRHFLE